MSNSRIISFPGLDSRYGADRPPVGRDANAAAVLIVGRSQINRVVVGKIVERSGLRPQSVAPEDAAGKLAEMEPRLVILDGGADNRDCEALMVRLVDQRRVSDKSYPRVILLSNRTGTPTGITLGSPVDAVVAKPITPESLQPVVDRLLPRAS